MTKLRINKFLSDAGICSRRGADEHILNGDVTVNGIVAKVGQNIDSETDKVKFKGKEVKAGGNQKIILAFYKPQGIISTFSDEETPNLNKYFKNFSGLKYAGRLDKDSEGLMILSTDGDLINKLSHPSFEHKKEYQIYAENEANEIDLEKVRQKMLKGVNIEGRLMKIDEMFEFQKSGKRLKFKVILSTGYNRQIRRMFAKIRVRVAKIIRTRIANLKLDDLKLNSGQYVEINKNKIL